MSYYRDSAGLEWKSRMALAIDGPSGTPGAPDTTFALPATHAGFWANVQSDGDDVRICASDGYTAKTFQFSVAFNSSTRAGTIQVDDGNTGNASTIGVLWLYYGNATATAPGGSFVAGTLWTAYTLVSPPAPDVRFEWHAEDYGRTAPADRFSKPADAEVVVRIRYRDVLAKRRVPFAGSLFEEEPATITYAVYNAAGSAQAAMIEAGSIRLDDHYVYVVVKAGTSGTEYTLRVTMTTATANSGMERTLIYSAVVDVQTPTV